MSKIKLSIIIPIYNVESYIEDCLDSLLNGTDNMNEIEVILIDDGSVDNSSNICKRYCQKYSFVKLIKQDNKGQAAARNHALSVAKGTWISYVDSDDKVVRSFLRILIDIIDNCTDDAELVMFKYNILKQSKREYSKFNREKLKEISKKEAMFLLTAPKYFGNYLWNKIYKRSLLQKIMLPEGKKYEDIATLYKYVYYSNKVFLYDDVLYFYRQRNGSTVHLIDARIGVDEIEARRNQLSFFKLHNYYEAFNRARYYFILSCIKNIELYSNTDKSFKISLHYLKENDITVKEVGIKNWLKIKIINVNPGLWKKTKKLKHVFNS